MKRAAMIIAAVLFMTMLSSCSRSGESDTNLADDTADLFGTNLEDDAADLFGTNLTDNAAGLTGTNPAESQPGEAASGGSGAGTGSLEAGHIDQGIPENLAGEYIYRADEGTGRLIIEKTSDGYDVSDYESESSYRFLADSSNIETVENNRISIKYPEQVFADGTAVFGYYILEYDTDGINVYYGKSATGDAQFLYHAAKVDESAASRREDTVQAGGKTDSEMTAEELLDAFINGSVNAADPADQTSTFYISDFDMALYSVGEKVDLDNDGENELILCGPYGGIYLDARDNRVYVLAAGDGNALVLSYTVYNGAVWIMYSNCMNAGYEVYHMEKYEGADNLAAEMNFSAESVDENNMGSAMKYMLNGAEISYEEYTQLGSKIFAAEVNTQ